MWTCPKCGWATNRDLFTPKLSAHCPSCLQKISNMSNRHFLVKYKKDGEQEWIRLRSLKKAVRYALEKDELIEIESEDTGNTYDSKEIEELAEEEYEF